MFVTPLRVQAQHEPDEWALTAPLIWQEPGLRVEVAEAFITDLASIPRLLRAELDVNGRSRRPSVLHDYAYCAQVLSRMEADDLLRRALIAEGESNIAARTYWLGVRAGGASHWAGRDGLQPDDFTSPEAFAFALAQPGFGFRILTPSA